MALDQLIWEVKTNINDYYDKVKADLDYHCQKILCKLEEAN